MTRGRGLVVLGAALAALGTGVWLAFRPPAASPPRFSMEVGARYAFPVRLHTHGWISPAAAHAALLAGDGPAARPGATTAGTRLPLDLLLEGNLEVSVDGERADGEGWSLSARLRDGRFTAAGGSLASAADLERPVAFSLAPDGHVTLPPGSERTEDRATAAVTALVAGLQVVLPPAERGAWPAREAWMDGEYETGYQLSDPPEADAPWRIRKHWHRFEPRRRPGESAPPLARRVVESRGDAVVAPGAPWFESLRWRLVLAEEAGGAQFALYRVEFEAARPERAPTRSRTPAHDGLTAPAVAPAPSAPPPPPPPAVARPVASGVPIAEAVTAFLARGPTGFVEARDALLVRLRADAAAPGELLAWLRAHGESLPDAERGRFWRLLAEAGTPAAQVAIADALRGDATDRNVGFALAQAPVVARPEPRLFDALWAFHDAGAGDGAGAPERRAMAAVAVGALAGGPDVAPSLAAAQTLEIARRLGAARDADGRRLYLAALGNAGREEALPAVRAALADPDLGTRASAADALRRVPGDAARNLLFDAYAGDPDPDVRVAVLTSLRARPADPRILDWALAEMPRAEEAKTQAALVHLVGELGRGDARVEPALRALHARNPDRNVRAAIYSYVPARSLLR